MTVVYSPQRAPDYAIHREGVTTVDTIADYKRGDGINMANYQFAHVQVIPKPASGADPTATVYWWSEAAGEFIQEHTPLAKAGVGANVPYEFTVECRGRIMFVAITTMAAGEVNYVLVSGFELNDAA